MGNTSTREGFSKTAAFREITSLVFKKVGVEAIKIAVLMVCDRSHLYLLPPTTLFEEIFSRIIQTLDYAVNEFIPHSKISKRALGGGACPRNPDPHSSRTPAPSPLLSAAPVPRPGYLRSTCLNAFFVCSLAPRRGHYLFDHRDLKFVLGFFFQVK